MKVKVVREKVVKPSKPTPPHLRTYKLSLLEETNPSINHIRLLYFSSLSDDGRLIDTKHIVCLEESLAEILPSFYPLAGRYVKEKREVDCNDQGAQYSTAEVDCDLSQIVGGAAEVEPEQLNQLLPVDIAAVDEPTDPMLAVQINRFRCGSLAIGVCASHRVIDSAAFAQFLTAWATAAASGGSQLIQPHFDNHSCFPAENLPPLDYHESETPEKIVTKRYVFDSQAIEKLRERLSTEWKSDRPPSRVVAVSAFLTQALLRADRARRNGKPRAAVIGQLINIRERTVPSVPKDTFGTWISGSFLELTAAETVEENLPRLAAKMRWSVQKGVGDCASVLSDKAFFRKVVIDSFFEAAEKANSPDWKVIWVTDISKFGEYDVDFGFGKPAWVSFAAMPLQDHIILFSNKNNDGFEAWVCLQETDMQFFRQDEEIPLLTANVSA
ncbi:hypothetical protein C2S51_019343 [Perilla frutescens var. frutescens]|nr:hypothetical protein C2S51_019343 [Perilla frutescens var. frutescens]